jgi:elongation factor G
LKEYGTQELRNVALVSHGGTGKTTLAEAMLFLGKVTTRLGRVDDGTSVLDHTEDEVERKITISSKLAHIEWKGHKINLIDTPGYADFVGDQVAGLRVADSVLFLLRADAGVEPATDNVWERVEAQSLPTILVATQMDRDNADFNRLVDSASALADRIVPLALPIGAGPSFKGIVDLLAMKAYEFLADGGRTEIPIPAELSKAVGEARSTLMDAAAEGDDALVEKYLEGQELSPQEIASGLSAAILARTLVPVVPVAAARLAGVAHLLDLIVTHLPSPAARGPVTARRGTTEMELAPNANGKVALLIWKTVSEGQAGEMSLIRVCSGRAVPGLDLVNPSRNTTTRLGHLSLVQGKDRKDIPALAAGDLGAALKLKEVKTGETLCDRDLNVVLPPIAYPAPTLTEAFASRVKGEEDKVSAGLTRLLEEDPTLHLTNDAALRQILVSGMGDLHLDLLTKRLKRRYGAAVDLVKPRIPYRETIRGKAEVQGRHKKQTGGRGQFGDVHLRVEPLPRGSGFEFVDEIVGGVVPNKFIPAVEKGVREILVDGVIAGYPVVDVRVALFYGSYHAVDSSEIAFKLAAAKAFKDGFEQARPVLLEPILEVEVLVPDEYMGEVMGDLSAKRGKILGMETSGKRKLLRAQVPQAEVYRYSTTLRSLTQGRAWHSEKFSHYEEVTADIQEKVVAESAKEREKEREKEKVG